MATPDEIEAEDKRDKKLVDAIAKVMAEKLSENQTLSSKAHREDHEFIAELKEAHEQKKKMRSKVIERLVEWAALGIAAFAGMALWNAFLAHVK